jgi:hypothetical protein
MRRLVDEQFLQAKDNQRGFMRWEKKRSVCVGGISA